MEITRRTVSDAVTAHNGFVRLDKLCEVLGMAPTPMNLWTTLDKLTSTILPAIKADVLEGERQTGIVLVSHRRRGTHGLKDGQFPLAVMPEKPTELLKKRRTKSEDDDKDAVDKSVPGLVVVDADWYNRSDELAALKADVSELFSSIDFGAAGPSVAFLSNVLVVSTKRDNDGGGTYATILLRNVK